MKTFEVTYEERVYRREPDPDCPMDTVYVGSSIERSTMRVLAPSRQLAIAYCDRPHDKDYKFIDCVDGPEVHAIIGVDHGLGFNWRRY